MTETVPTYRSLLVHYDPCGSFRRRWAKSSCARSARPQASKPGAGAFLWPMAASMASTSRMSPRPSARRPTNRGTAHAGEYRVAMIGFTPGWSYLSGLRHRLQMPRRQNPPAVDAIRYGLDRWGADRGAMHCRSQRLASARTDRGSNLSIASRSDLPAGAWRRHQFSAGRCQDVCRAGPRRGAEKSWPS